jgi:hypothetical protein
LGLKSTFFNGSYNYDEDNRISLDVISPKFAQEIKDIEIVQKYLALPDNATFMVEISTKPI